MCIYTVKYMAESAQTCLSMWPKLKTNISQCPTNSANVLNNYHSRMKQYTLNRERKKNNTLNKINCWLIASRDVRHPPTQRTLKQNPWFTDLLTSWSGMLSKPTWPARGTVRAPSPYKHKKGPYNITSINYWSCYGLICFVKEVMPVRFSLVHYNKYSALNDCILKRE